MDKVNIYEVLTDLGYKLKDFGKEYRARPLYRDSDNDTVLKIYKDTGHWFDFKENISGDFNSLISMTLKLDDPQKAKEWLKNKNFIFNKPKDFFKPLIKTTKKFDINLLSNLKNDHSYWNKRGISDATLNEFKGGIANAGKMKNRYVFPIFDFDQSIIGFSGRTLINSTIKWKHLGEKKDWVYPLFLNKNFFESKKIILVESIGDCLALWEAGLKNVIVTFGLSINIGILNFLLRSDFNKIFICFNNDFANNSAGNIAANKAKSKLLRYFDRDQIKIVLPNKKDFGEMTKEEIFQWKANL